MAAEDVGRAVGYMASLALDVERAVHDGDGDQDAVRRTRISAAPPGAVLDALINLAFDDPPVMSGRRDRCCSSNPHSV